MEQKYIRFKKFKDLDLFIQNTLDKYFYVDPWKKLYERTGKLHRDIISDKSTIPDLIIYNKTFNKSDCFLESNQNSFIKFPRMRFILRPKYKREYNPSSTYGKGDEVYFYKKQKIKDDKNSNTNINLNSNNKFKEEDSENKNGNKTFLKQNLEKDLDKLFFEQNNKINDGNPLLYEGKNLEDEDDEEEPEWANDNVEQFNNKKIEFQAIPKSLEEKMIEELELNSEDNNNKNLEKMNINNINIDNFFEINDDNNLDNSPKDNILQEIKDFMNNDAKEINTLKEENNTDKKIKESDRKNENNLNINLDENINEHFNIFDTENKFNDIFIRVPQHDTGKDDQNNNINIEDNKVKCSRFLKKNESNEILNEFNKNKELKDNQIKQTMFLQDQQQIEKQKYLQMIRIQRLNNQVLKKQNNQNIIQQQSPYMFFNPYYNMNNNSFNNNSNLLFSNQFGNCNFPNNINYQNFNGGVRVLNNFNYNPYNNIQNTNISKMNMINPNRFYNTNSSVLNSSNVNNDNKDIYVNNINNMIYANNNYKLNQNIINKDQGIINQKVIDNQKNFKSINNFNNINYLALKGNNKIPYNICKNVQYDEINPNIYSYKNNNINNINNMNNNLIYKVQNNFSEQNNSKKEVNNLDNNNNNKYVNTADYLENPTLFITKNSDKKNWLVLNTNNSVIQNFNSKDLLNFLEEKEKNNISLDEFTINDFDIDVVFPAKEIYENLKKFYSYQK